jgi:predicted PurR-regulated permease PerM
MKVQRTWQSICVSIILALVGLGMLGFWGMWLAQGNLVDGVNTVENNNYIVFHILAESLAGIAALRAAAGLFMRWQSGRRFVYIAGGMVIYSTINSLGESVKNLPSLTPVLIGNLVAILICFAFLWSERRMAKGSRQMVPVHN